MKEDEIDDNVFLAHAMTLAESTGSGTSDDIDLTNLNGILTKNVSALVDKNKKKKSENNLHAAWFIAIAKSDDVKKFLEDHSLGNDSDYARLDKEYSFVFLTHPRSADKIKRSDGIKFGGETQGYSLFNPDSVKNIITGSLDTKEDFNVFTTSGVPSKTEVNSDIFKGSTSKNKLTYYNSAVLPNYKVYLASFDIDLDEPIPPNPPTPPTPPTPPSDKKKKKLTDAYIIMFGNEKLDKVEVNDVDVDVDATDVDRNDLYIIPMSGLKYEDPEFANKKLI